MQALLNTAVKKSQNNSHFLYNYYPTFNIIILIFVHYLILNLPIIIYIYF